MEFWGSHTFMAKKNAEHHSLMHHAVEDWLLFEISTSARVHNSECFVCTTVVSSYPLHVGSGNSFELGLPHMAYQKKRTLELKVRKWIHHFLPSTSEILA